jgi:BMFP domain-containing protein YqiC
MFDTSAFESLAQKLYAALPDSLKHLETDLQTQFKDILRSAFTQIDLVTREEFDVQTKVLSRTREKVDMLQAKLDDFLK